MNQKGFTKIIIIILLVAVLSIVGYFVWSNWLSTSSQNDSINTNESSKSWQFIDANSFTLYLPPGWKFNELQGTDSYVGEFVGDSAKLSFDFGWYGNCQAYDKDSHYIVTKEVISSHEARFIRPNSIASSYGSCTKNSDCSSETWPCDTSLGSCVGRRTMGVCFDNLGEGGQSKFWLYGDNFSLTLQETALKIFRTIKIVR